MVGFLGSVGDILPLLLLPVFFTGNWTSWFVLIIGLGAHF